MKKEYLVTYVRTECGYVVETFQRCVLATSQEEAIMIASKIHAQEKYGKLINLACKQLIDRIALNSSAIPLGKNKVQLARPTYAGVERNNVSIYAGIETYKFS